MGNMCTIIRTWLALHSFSQGTLVAGETRPVTFLDGINRLLFFLIAEHKCLEEELKGADADV